jgi:TolA-binding protein
MTTLRSQNEKLKKEVESLSTALAELEAEDSGGLFGALLGTGSSAAFKKKIKDLEAVVEAETAAKTALETKLRELALEHEALKAKNAPPSTLGSFFGF